HLKCSIDGATRETYRRVRGTDAFDRVLANVRRFAEASEGNPRMKLIFVYVVMRENLQDVVPFVDVARAFDVERVEFHPVRPRGGWRVGAGTGWVSDGPAQWCEFSRAASTAVMRAAAARCAALGLRHEVVLLP